ncbi:MAG: hypothetical protein KDI24_01315 [Pseudomonadales bacterium]|nr:hypothetical protein [Pseudomonadales bacterium]MCP5172993.1 hypothetical protein [Pseudomonadales bacterium]MCP5302466.1 hypothetical protein [Pseudomonadales bacterium]
MDTARAMDSFTLNRLRMFALQWLCSLALLCGACFSLAATDTHIAVLLSGKTPYYIDASEQLQTTLHENLQHPPQLDVVQISDTKPKELESKNYRLIVTVGSTAAQFAASNLNHTPILTTFLPKSSFEKITRNLPSDRLNRFSAVYLDQPLQRIVNLGRLLKPEAEDIGTVLGPISKSYLDELIRIAQQQGFNLHTRTLGNQDNPVAALKPVVATSDLFIAIPDQAILNRSVAKWILYLSYSEKIPVIGFSKAYTDAGALASVFSSPRDIGRQTGELISRWINNGDELIWAPQYPKYCTVKANPAVARSLGIHLPGEQELTSLFEAMEHK